KLQASGIVDCETAKSLGKILGVEGIITGTMMNIAKNRLEVNARLIKTETAEILIAGSMIIKKNWGIQNTVQQAQTPSHSQYKCLRQQRRLRMVW
ncbi:hypothetical protein ACFL4O_01775, partial [bacterium]